MPTIDEILQDRSAFLKGEGGDTDVAARRCNLTMAIEHNYPAFEVLRDELLGNQPKKSASPLVSHSEAVDFDFLFDHMLDHEVLVREQDQFAPNGLDARRFMTGGWLEELAWLAAMEAGADEASYSQLVGWNAGGYEGENEIDVIFRKGERLGFISCKALRSSLQSSDRKHRSRMMDAVHEADNLADHFGKPQERVGVLVTTDLFDEEKGEARYQALMGKAAVLDVRLIPLEDLHWDKLVGAVRQLMED